MMARIDECVMCERGEVWIECCNGSQGCPCKGKQVFWGTCLVCGGTGRCSPEADKTANLKAMTMQARSNGGYFGNPHGRLREGPPRVAPAED